MISRFAAEIATALRDRCFGVIVMVGALEFGIGWSEAGPEPGAFPFYIGLLIVAGAASSTSLRALR